MKNALTMILLERHLAADNALTMVLLLERHLAADKYTNNGYINIRMHLAADI